MRIRVQLAKIAGSRGWEFAEIERFGNEVDEWDALDLQR
jgi:hypothetical protein